MSNLLVHKIDNCIVSLENIIMVKDEERHFVIYYMGELNRFVFDIRYYPEFLIVWNNYLFQKERR